MSTRSLSHPAVACLAAVALLGSALACWAESNIDVVAYFQSARDAGRAGIARKTKDVDVRAAKPGEVVVTTIAGEGKETVSPPARPGDMVVRNRCEQSGNEELLISGEKFPSRYEGPIGEPGADGYRPYRPRGVPMRFVVVTDQDGTFSFTAPWGERMIARPGDAIVQEVDVPSNTYRVQKDAFACTYEVVEPPPR